MSDIIGSRFILSKKSSPALPSAEPDEFVCVEVIATSDPVGNYSGEPKEDAGWRARGDDGLIYYSNWHRYPEDSRSPRSRWSREDGENWWQVTSKVLLRGLPKKPVFVDRYPDVISYCPKHQKLSYIREEEPSCYKCRYETSEQAEAPVEKEWNGWFED